MSARRRLAPIPGISSKLDESPSRLRTERWNVTRSTELYDISRWGKGYFSVSDEGHLLVHPTREPGRSISLKKLVDTLVLRLEAQGRFAIGYYHQRQAQFAGRPALAAAVEAEGTQDTPIEDSQDDV